MSQHDYVLDNAAGGVFRADLNNALLAIVSLNAGTSAPSTTYAYMIWADTTTGKKKRRNAANSAWIEEQPYLAAIYGGLAPALPISPGGRVTLTSATPVTTSDVTAAATIYYAFYEHGFVPLYDGTGWLAQAFTELSLALDSNSGHTGYHQSGKNFDVFIDYNSGTPRLVTGPAWTNDTTRADAIARKDGRWTNNASMTVRFGTSSGDTATMAANTGLYVGSIRCTADGQTEDSLAKRFVFNAYNRLRRLMRVNETTNTWTYTTDTYRQANGSAANQLDFLIGLSETGVVAQVRARYQNSSSSVECYCAIGLDGTSGPANDCGYARAVNYGANLPTMLSSDYKGHPGLGRHYLAWLERSAATGTGTWYGDNGGTPPIGCITGELFA